MGIKNAKGNVIVVMGAHTEYPSDFILSAITCLERTDADVVGGPVDTIPGADTLMARAISLATSHPFGVGNSKFRTSTREGYVDTVPFGAYRREVFNKVGLFNERLVRNQDNEFSSRVIKSGGKIYFTPKLTANYYSQATLKGLLQQAFKTGMWNVLTVTVNPQAFQLRHFVPFAFVTTLIGLLLLAPLQSWAKFALYGLLLLYGIAAIISTISIWLKERTFSAVFLPLIFPAYHISYGLGTWGGLFKIVLSRTVNLDKLLAKDESSSGTT